MSCVTVSNPPPPFTSYAASTARLTFPKLRIARSRGSAGDIPALMFASTCISTCKRISRSMSSITVSRCRNARTRSRKIFHHFILLTPLRSLSHFRDREHESIPARFLRFELLAAGARQFVKLRVTSGFVYVPARGDPTLLLDAIERRIQRALLHVEHLVGA